MNKNKDKQSTSQKNATTIEEKATGYGDKKLEGPNRPAE
jgi:hypothetical protein